MKVILVFVFAGLGGLLRYGIQYTMQGLSNTFPYHTLVANFLSCLLLGLLFFYAPIHNALSDLWKTVLFIGFCGGFSTFSSFTLDTYKLWDKGLYLLSLINITLSVLLCMFGLLLGYIIQKYL